MIKTEFYITRYDGVDLYRTYSDEGFYITRNNEIYEEAIDPEGTNRIYTELRMNDKIPGWRSPDEIAADEEEDK